MMSAPVGRDKDAVFKHKRVAETKGCTRVAVDTLFMPVRDRRFVPCLARSWGLTASSCPSSIASVARLDAILN